MKKFRFVVAAMALSATLLLSAGLQAQSVVFLAAGSSAMFNDMAYTATVFNSQGYVLCGPNVWTKKKGNGGAQIVDNRAGVGVIPNETGDVWVTWNGNANGTGATKICAYVSVDSSVGVRAALANPTATISIAAALNGSAGDNYVPNLPNPDSALPNVIYTALNGQAFTVGATDVRPEDTKFATVRSLSPLGGTIVDPNPYYNNPIGTILFAFGLGYASAGNPNIGNPIQSSQSTAVAHPINFALFGQDPFGDGTHEPAYQWVTIPVGAGPVVVFVNTTDASGLGNGKCLNINTSAFCGMLDGTLQRNIDACEPPTATVAGVPVFLREPISGTYNTTEFSTAASFQCLSTQEKNVNPAVQNPLNMAGTIAGSNRARVIGTGEMVKTVAATADSLGYAFWGYGNFSASNNNAPTNTHYLTVDGNDPLYANGANPSQAFPVPSGGVFPPLSFPNIQNGTYRIWTTYRFVVPNLANYDWALLFAQIGQSDAASQYSDYIPFSSLNVFHDHFYQSNIGAYNNCTSAESGGDMGGLVYTCTQEAGYEAANGGQHLIQKHM